MRSGALVVANADGSARRVICESPLSEDVAGPASSRGDTILFGVSGFFQRATIMPAQVMRINADGTGLTALTHDSVTVAMLPARRPFDLDRQVANRVARSQLILMWNASRDCNQIPCPQAP